MVGLFPTFPNNTTPTYISPNASHSSKLSCKSTRAQREAAPRITDRPFRLEDILPDILPEIVAIERERNPLGIGLSCVQIAELVELLGAYLDTLEEPPRNDFISTNPNRNEAFTSHLLRGNGVMKRVLGMKVDTFNFTLQALKDELGFRGTPRVSAEETLAISLYMFRTGKSARQTAHQFARSNSTCSWAFKHSVKALSHAKFRRRFVVLPTDPTVQPPATNRFPKLKWILPGGVEAVDGTFIAARAKGERETTRNGSSFNVIAGVDFDMRFIFMLSGEEGINDVSMWEMLDTATETGGNELQPSQLSLGDSALPEDPQPKLENQEESFNLRHHSARIVVERVFGAVQSRWKMMKVGNSHSMKIKVRTPLAIAVLHNILMHREQGYEEEVWNWTVEERDPAGEDAAQSVASEIRLFHISA